MTEEAKDRAINIDSSGNNIDHVRDILFGVQMREYDSRLAKLETDLSALKAELQTATQAIERKLEAFEQDHQTEVDDLRQEVSCVNQKLVAGVQQLDEAMDTQITGVRRELLKSMHSLRSQMVRALQQQIIKLQDAQLSRDDISEMLIVLARRIKGAEQHSGIALEQKQGMTTSHLTPHLETKDLETKVDTLTNGKQEE
ncbi:MAG: hypothetical protein F6K42_21420 [Leptolyngbya sp. SIO1D8]|nr:hypothetical protein [Leptolyngbya sp. SIO1D8]